MSAEHCSNIAQLSPEGMNGEKKMAFRVRYMMAILGSIGVAISTGLNANISIAMIGMVNHTAIRSIVKSNISEESSSSVCPHDAESEVDGAVETKDGPFAWDEGLQGVILSSYYAGAILGQIPAGRIAELYSAAWMVNVSMLLNVIPCLLSPLAAQLHCVFFIVLRTAQGFGGGAIYPAMHVLIANWATPEDRNMLSSITYTGFALGHVIFTNLSGFLVQNFGWASIFYVEGAISIPWCVVWWYLVQDSPEQQTVLITEHERNYIIRSQKRPETQTTKKKLPIPWRQVFLSAPFWAIFISQTFTSFGWSVLLVESTIYMSRILKFNPNESATFATLPYMCMWLFSIILGKTLTMMQSKGWITMSVSRKMAVFVASFVPMCCFISITYVGCNRITAVVLFTLAGTCQAGQFSGSFVNHIDIAPNFAGTLMALTSTSGQITAFIVPLFVGAMTNGNQTLQAWRTVFFVTGGMYAVDFCTYLTFGTAEEQAWNNLKKNREQELEDRNLRVKSPLIKRKKTSSEII